MGSNRRSSLYVSGHYDFRLQRLECTRHAPDNICVVSYNEDTLAAALDGYREVR